MDQRAKAERFLALHSGPDILVLPNAWDAISARIVEAEGFPAGATGSAGVAAVLGYPDGQRIPRKEMMFMVARMAAAVDIPMTADVEAGYDDPVETARDVIAAGAVGMNFEDMVDEVAEKGSGSFSATAAESRQTPFPRQSIESRQTPFPRHIESREAPFLQQPIESREAPLPRQHVLVPLPEQLEKIRAVKAAVRSLPGFVLNARTDIFLAKHGDEATRFDRAVERLNAFREVGADCLFAPGVVDAETIGRLVKAVRGPLNILASIGTPPIAELKRLGVRRVSLGSGPSRVSLGVLQRFARKLRDEGTFEALATEAIPYAEVQKILSRKA
jgi:2-methylisocitrate lyase-like PEP mutase family enzyme